MAAKAAATGPGRSSKLTLSFGLVNVPVRYKPLAETEKAVSARMMCPEHGATLKQGYTCSVGTEHEHPMVSEEIVKGYPHPDDPSRLVQVDASVLEEFAESRTGAAQIQKIVDVDTIDPAYFDKVYLVWPDAGGAEAFDLLVSVLRAENKAAVTTTVIYKQTRTVVFRWSEELGCLLGHVCRFASQLRLGDVETVKAVAVVRQAPPKEQVAAAQALFATLEGKFDPAACEDEWAQQVQAAIRQAADGGTIETPKQATVAAPASDLVASLMASLGTAKPKAAKPRTTKPNTRKEVAV